MSIRVDFSPAYQSRRDLEICILAFGDVRGSRSFYLPRGDMASDAFDREVNAAWERLTRKQQVAIVTGQFTLNVGTWIDALTGAQS